MERTLILMGLCLFVGVQSAPTEIPDTPDELRTMNQTVPVPPTEEPLPGLGYIAMAPKFLVAGTTETVCIHLLKYEEPVELSIVLMKDNETQISYAPLYIMERRQDCVKISVPEIDEDSLEVILRVQAKRLFAPQVEFEVVADKRVFIKSYDSDTFIQTDKPIYKPGQTVYFRLMTLDQELRPDTSAFSEIWIEASNGIRLAQWKDQKSDDGLIDLNMPMTPDPVLGDWKIVAIQNGKKTEQTFKVDEYVLPRYEIVVTTPPFLRIDEEEFDVEICGIYTYGQPVEGSFSGVLTVKTNGYEYRPRPVVVIENQDTGKSGCGSITVNTTAFNLRSTDHSIWDAYISVSVDFTEKNTGFVVSETIKGGKVTSDPLKLTINAPGTFKPGVPFFGEIHVKYPDDSPAGEQLISFTARTNDGEIMEKNYTSPANGVIQFQVPDIDIESNSLNLYAGAPGYSTDEYNYREYNIYNPSSSHFAKPRYSPSGSFIQMSPIRGQVAVNSEQTIDIYYTSDAENDDDDPKNLITYVFMSRGNIIDGQVLEGARRRRQARIEPPSEITIHRGDCPSLDEGAVGTCAFQCDHDGDCAESEKCCSNGCGTQCVPAVLPDCPQVCPFIYFPVCGSDGIDYVSDCELKRAACEGDPELVMAYTGECNPGTTTGAPDCPTFCIELYAPVCGSNGETYSNECKLQKAACDTQADIQIDYTGECRECSLRCTRERRPVCGTDGKTYSNKCLLDVEQCTKNLELTVEYTGECRECPEVCPLILSPVCGTDNQSYPNTCELNRIACENKNWDLVVASEGNCLPDVPPPTEGPEICALIYAPVCATNGKTYGSHCEMRLESKRLGLTDLIVDYPGDCEPDVEIAEPGQLRKIQRTFVVTPDMSPVVRVLAYYIRSDGEVVADAMTFKVQPTFKNKVEIKFKDQEARPGRETQMKVSAAPNSLCALGIVDKSVHILGGDNTITKDKVFSALEKYQLSSSGGQAEWSDHCPDSSPWWWREIDFRRRKRSVILPASGVEYDDASHAFQDMGLVFLSNLDVETRPCTDPFPSYQVDYRFESDGGRGAPLALPLAFPRVGDVEEEVNLEADSAAAQLRNYFPETWLWSLERTGPTGNITIDLEVPHTITEWVSNGFCTSFYEGLGVSSTSYLKAFQPFFVSVTLPYSVIRGETVPVTANIFNYLEECLVIEATFAEDSRVPLVDAAESVQRVCICGGDSKPVTFMIAPTSLGNIPVRVDAASVADTGALCGNEIVASGVRTADAIEKELLVEAEGVEQVSTYSNYVCPADHLFSTYYERLPMILPPEYVEGSERAKVQVTGDIMGSTLNNLENLIRRPYGCGEQNMLGFVPNIVVMKYLNSTDQLTPQIATRTTNNMRIGYQRELNYRRTDGSYSAFGNTDPEGSTWLTAFVMMSFAQASEYISIDEKDLSVSFEWLKQQQDSETGCFNAVGMVHHKAMKGGVNNGVTLTAYVLLAMLEGGVSKEDPAVTNALECLHEAVDSLSDTYTAAQMSYALVLAGSDRLDEVLATLESLATQRDTFKFWESNRDDIPSDFTYGYEAPLPAQNIEMTAYALLACIENLGRQALTECNSVARWIIQKRNPNGGFSSTQDTVVALQALSEYAKLAYQGGISMRLDVKIRTPSGYPDTTIHLTDTNRLLQQEVQVPVPSALVLKGQGQGCVLVQVAVKYNIIPKPPPVPPFTLTTAIKDISNPEKNPCTQYAINTCTSYSGPDSESNMALVQIKMVSGFYPDKHSLKELQKTGPESFRRAEFEKNMVNLYFDKMTEEQICFSIIVVRDIFIQDAKPGVISVTDYYEKDMTVSDMYELPCTAEMTGPRRGGPLAGIIGRIENLLPGGRGGNGDGDENVLPGGGDGDGGKLPGTDKVEPTEPPKVEPTEPPKVEPTEQLKDCVDNNGVQRAHGDSYQEGPCTDCFCANGANVCAISDCFWPTCPGNAQPVTLPGDCCPRCPAIPPPQRLDSCITKDFSIKTDGESWTDPENSCEDCYCDKGEVLCNTIYCDWPTCPGNARPVYAPGACCPGCPDVPLATTEFTWSLTCTAEDGSTKYAGDLWDEGPCTSCTCENGFSQCLAMTCELLACPDNVEPVTKPGQCCPECPEIPPPLSLDSCTSKDGTTKTDGESWTDPENSCEDCYCNNGEVLCNTIYCDWRAPNCPGNAEPVYAPGVCCPGCPDVPLTCTAEDGSTKYAGDSWNEGPCTSCTCENGFPLCLAMLCELLACPDNVEPVTKPGQCCQECPDAAIPEPEPQPETCPDFCASIYQPVCGSNDKTYSNTCELQKAQCNDPTITLAREGRCEDSVTSNCPEICATIYAPVCGSNEQTYSNECKLQIAACNDPTITLAREGRCEDSVALNCPEICATIYAPVCGSNEKTYSNECKLQIAACNDPTITLARSGRCEDAIVAEPEAEPEAEPTAEPAAACPEICTADYNPVCGSDGQTYSNLCSLEIAQCNDPSIEFLTDGGCPQPVVDGICEQDPTICGDNALCRSNEEGYTCECIEGYQTNEQGLCDDQNECEMAADICGANGICENIEGTYSCSCAVGYERDDAADGSDTCIDIDECQQNVMLCGDYGNCTNLPGSYECSCIEGYTRVNDQCVVSCPVCAEELPSGWHVDYCNADFVYVTKVRKDGQLRLLRSMSLTDGDVAVTERRYVKPEWDERCSCDIITSGARITVMGSTLNYRQEVIGEEVIYLDSKSYVTLTTEAKSSIERAQPNCP